MDHSATLRRLYDLLNGKSFDVQLIDIMRFADDGLVHEHWGVVDMLAMLQQLGVVPEGPAV